MQDHVDCWYSHEHDTSKTTYHSADFQPIATCMRGPIIYTSSSQYPQYQAIGVFAPTACKR